MGSVLIVSGPVGAGKTTVCRELIASASGPTAYIEGDSFWTYIAKPAAQQSPPEQFRTIMHTASFIALSMVSSATPLQTMTALRR